MFLREVTRKLNNERVLEREHLRGFTKLLGLTGSVLVPAKSEPGLNLPLGFATQRHQTNNFTLKQQWKGEIDDLERDGAALIADGSVFCSVFQEPGNVTITTLTFLCVFHTHQEEANA